MTGKIIVLSVIQRSKQNFLIALDKEKKKDKRKLYVMPKINWSLLQSDSNGKEDLRLPKCCLKLQCTEASAIA